MGYTKNYYTILKMGRNSTVILPSKFSYSKSDSTNTYSYTQQKLLIPSGMEGKTIAEIKQESGASEYPFMHDTLNYFGFLSDHSYGSAIASTHTTSNYPWWQSPDTSNPGIYYIIRASYQANPTLESVNDYDLEGDIATIHDSVDYTLNSTRTSGGNIELSFSNNSEHHLSINQIGIYAQYVNNKRYITPYVPDEVKDIYDTESGYDFGALIFLVYRKVLSETLVVPPKSSRSILLGFQLG